MPSDPTHEAEAFLSLLWRNIYTRVRQMLHPHHFEHEPGGKDRVSLPVGFLRNVTIDPDTVAVGQTLVVDAVGDDGETWVNGAGGGGASDGQAFFQVVGSISTGYIPGPTNIFGTAVTITRVLFSAGDDVAGAEVLTGQAFSFSGGGSDDNTGLSVTWADGERLGMNITSAGTVPSYLTADVRFTMGTA